MRSRRFRKALKASGISLEYMASSLALLYFATQVWSRCARLASASTVAAQGHLQVWGGSCRPLVVGRQGQVIGRVLMRAVSLLGLCHSANHVGGSCHRM